MGWWISTKGTKRNGKKRWWEMQDGESLEHMITLYKKSLLLILLYEYDNHVDQERSFRELTPQRKKLNKLYKIQTKRWVIVITFQVNVIIDLLF